MKQCSKCKEIKPLQEFKAETNKWCMECKIMCGVDPGSFHKVKREFVDQDYIGKLKDQAKSQDPVKSKEAMDALLWLGRFNQEFYLGQIKKGDENALNKTDEHRKDCYRRNNRSNKDAFSVSLVNNLLTHSDSSNQGSI